MTMTSKEFRKELIKSMTTTKNLEEGIKHRLIKLINTYPNAPIMKNGTDTFYCNQITKQWLDDLSTESMLRYMRNIEEHYESLQRGQQLSFNF